MTDLELIPPKRTPPIGREPAPTFRDRWRLDHGLQAHWFESKLVNAFARDGNFLLVNHDNTGRAREDLSVEVREDRNPKYKAPVGVGVVPYAPMPDAWERFRSAKTKYIVEGHAKAIAMYGLGLPVIGIPGISAWHRGKTNGESDWRLHEWIDEAIHRGDTVIVIPDGDWATNSRVGRDSQRLLDALNAREVELASVLDLSRSPTPGGIDDAIMFWRAQNRDPLAELAALPRLTSLAPVLVAEQLPEDFASHAAPEPLAVIPGILPCRSGILFAPGGERKSTLATLMAAHVVLARPIFGRNITLPGRVLYVTGEDELEDVQRTVKYMIDAGGLPMTEDEAADLRDGLRIVDVSRTGGATLSRKVNGAWEAGTLLPLVEKSVQEVGDVALVILDTMSALGFSETEGMNEAAAAYHREALRICKTHQLCIMALHHVSKEFATQRRVDQYGGRGGGAIVDNSRFALQLQRDQGEANYPAPEPITHSERQGSVEGTAVYRLHVHKARWGYRSDRPLWVRSTGWKYETFDAVSPLQAATSRTEAAKDERNGAWDADDSLLLTSLRELEAKGVAITKDQVKSIEGLSERRAVAALDRLVDTGRVEKEEEQREGLGRRKQLYRVKRGKWEQGTR